MAHFKSQKTLILCQTYRLFSTLLLGATLVIIPPLTSSTSLLPLQTVSVLVCTPTFLSTLNPKKHESLKIVIVAGEAASRSLVDLWAGRVKMVNAYGPTEATIMAAYGVLKVGEEVTIGRVVVNAVSIVAVDGGFCNADKITLVRLHFGSGLFDLL